MWLQRCISDEHAWCVLTGNAARYGTGIAILGRHGMSLAALPIQNLGTWSVACMACITWGTCKKADAHYKYR